MQAYIRRLRSCAGKQSGASFKSPAHDRLVDEAEYKTFFVLTPFEADWFIHPRRGWEQALERFPNAGDDVEEASKCFALSHYAASIFH
jgi:hypothetical protein